MGEGNAWVIWKKGEEIKDVASIFFYAARRKTSGRNEPAVWVVVATAAYEPVDVCEIEMTGLGVLRNVVADERRQCVADIDYRWDR
jgi:hypothetical protein